MLCTGFGGHTCSRDLTHGRGRRAPAGSPLTLSYSSQGFVTQTPRSKEQSQWVGDAAAPGHPSLVCGC